MNWMGNIQESLYDFPDTIRNMFANIRRRKVEKRIKEIESGEGHKMIVSVVDDYAREINSLVDGYSEPTLDKLKGLQVKSSELYALIFEFSRQLPPYLSGHMRELVQPLRDKVKSSQDKLEDLEHKVQLKFEEAEA